MRAVRSCGCKGIRSCLICEKELEMPKKTVSVYEESRDGKVKSYVYCPYCDKLLPGWNVDEYKKHPHHNESLINFPGVYIKPDFLSEDETERLIEALDHLPWQPSQSGRRKQNFGPKCNFKKQKLRLGTFDGFPRTTQFVQEKFGTVSLMNDFKTVEQCSLEYTPERGSSIDPHIDDCWIWGERIVTVNVLGDSALTMTPHRGPITQYNLNCVSNYSSILENDIRNSPEIIDIDNNIVVRLPMPARSLMILHGLARYKWEHSVLRQDITSRRICLAYRELTPPFLENGERHAEASEILRHASFFR